MTVNTLSRQDTLKLSTMSIARCVKPYKLLCRGEGVVFHGKHECFRLSGTTAYRVSAAVIESPRMTRLIRGADGSVVTIESQLQRHLHEEVWVELHAFDETFAKMGELDYMQLAV